MKRTLILLLLTTGFAFSDERYSDEIRVEHSDGGPFYTLYLDSSSGSRNDRQGVFGSVRYQLYTIKIEDNTYYFLDEKTVSSFHPQASIKIISQDPYEDIPRTRVDVPFSIEYTIDGIVTDDPDVDKAAKSVIFHHEFLRYRGKKNEAPANANHTVHDHHPVTTNGTFKINNVLTQIASPDLTSLRGEEIFSIYANPNFGKSKQGALLSTARIQVWPIAKGTISGIDTKLTYAKIPTIAIDLKDLYPKSNTYLRFYKGAPTENPDQVQNCSWSKNKNDVIPEDISFVFTNLDSEITKDATYTIELVHETPFGLDLLSQVYPLTVKRSIKINGSINSSE